MGKTGAGKTSLVKRLLRLRPDARVLIFDPKPAADETWADDPGSENTWGLPVPEIYPGFGSGAEGGGPRGYWFRMVATPDREATGRAYAAGLDIVRTEGHAIVVVDDAREVCHAFDGRHKLSQGVESLMLLGRSNATAVILATQETGYVPGRAQGSFLWAGHISGIDAAKAGAQLLGKRGGAWYDTMAAVEPYSWVYLDAEPGSAGPALTYVPA
ncbi:MAG: hypothetical protein ACLP52_31850 [Streptosporangiaceae bacterium]